MSYKILDLKNIESPKAQAIRKTLERKVVGQQEGINALVDIIEKYHAKLHDKNRPIGSALFLGPTGSGKTRLVESFCAAIGQSEHSCVKIDCGEFQHSHEIAKLIGSPPGYLGHRETPPRLKQNVIDALFTPDYGLAVIFFDEIEKASDSLWHLLLGILDKAKVTCGDSSVTDFSNTIILMTSNAGSSEMDRILNGGGLGFAVPSIGVDEAKIADIGISAAKTKFTPEFINRLDRMVAFHTLSKAQIERVCDLEIEAIQTNILMHSHNILFLKISPAAKKALIEEGYDPKYNGRNIRRTIEKRIELPVARIIASELTKPGSELLVDYKRGEYQFGLLERPISANAVNRVWGK
jgi:ATP-dependent Clp protease ATP-binding subunit ClpB